jgi:hypothetical protein
MHRRVFLQISMLSSLTSLVSSRSWASTTLLTVGGDVAGQTPHTFTDEELSALDQVEFTTSTIWTARANRFSGPSLKTVLAAVGAGPGHLELRAVNDYRVTLSQTRIEKNTPIIANRINGLPFGIREKGPLWLIFPYDSDTRYQQEEIYALSIWQLMHVDVLPT